MKLPVPSYPNPCKVKVPPDNATSIPIMTPPILVALKLSTSKLRANPLPICLSSTGFKGKRKLQSILILF